MQGDSGDGIARVQEWLGMGIDCWVTVEMG